MNYNDIENHMVIDQPANRIPRINLTLDVARESADSMSIWQMLEWFDDLEAVLARMPAKSRNDYYEAHRSFVVSALIEDQL